MTSTLPRFVLPSERSHLLIDDESNGYGYDSSCYKSLACQNTIIINGHISPETDGNTATATKNRSRWHIIIFGQTIALSLSCANAASSILENKYHITIPTFLTGLVYLVLSFHLVYLFSRERIKQNVSDKNEEKIDHQTQQRKYNQIHKFPFTNFTLFTPWYTYLLLAIMDVEANFLALLSLQHTSLSSSMLLASLSVLTTVLLRQLILGSAPCGRKRILGVLLCLVGGCSWLLEDFYHESATANGGLDSILHPPQKHTYIIYGDLLALAASCIFGLNDVLAEYFLKSSDDQTHSRVEYLGMLGLCGAIFSFGVQVPILEMKNVQDTWAEIVFKMYDQSADAGEIVLLVLFAIVMLCFFYASAMIFISMNDATILNLSLQTCPMWAVVLTMLEQSITAQGDGSMWAAVPPAMFFFSFAMVAFGMFLYESCSRNNEQRCINV